MVRRESSGGKFLKIVGCGCLVLGLLLAAILITVYVKRKNIVAAAGSAVLTEVVKKSGLPEDQKARIIESVDRLADDYKGGRITTEQLGQVAEALAESPVLPLGLLYSVGKDHLNRSGLSEAEKAAGRLEIQRFSRGAVEGKIAAEDVVTIVEPVQEPDEEAENIIKEEIADEDLRTLLAAAKAKADEAGIPIEPYEVDFAAEVQKIIDEVLEGKKEPAEAEPSQTPAPPAPDPEVETTAPTP